MVVQRPKKFIRKTEEEKKPARKAAVKKVVKEDATLPPPLVEEKPVIITAPIPEAAVIDDPEEEKVVETSEPQEEASDESSTHSPQPSSDEQTKESKDEDNAHTTSEAVEVSEPKESAETNNGEQKPETEEKSEPSTSTIQPFPPIEVKEKKSRFIWQFVLFVFIGFALGSGFFLSQELLMKGIPAMKKALPTTVIEEVHIPTQPAEEKDETKTYTISVLNGSGIGGEAAKAKDILEGEKYTVENVGNADTSDHTQTLIQAKKAVAKEYLSKLKKSLESNDYIVSEPESLSETEDTDVVIVIGSSRKE